MTPLGTAEVAKIAHLARLAIHEENAPAYARNLSAILELVEQMNAVDTTGVTPMAHPLDDMAQRLRAGLAQLPAVSVLGPTDPTQTTGLLGFTVQGWQPGESKALVDQLYRDHRILIKYQPEEQGLRVSLAAFNTLDEVELLVGHLGELIGKTR